MSNISIKYADQVLSYADYAIGIFFMSGKFKMEEISLLADPEFFRRAETDGIIVKWDNKIELSAAEMFRLAQK